MPAELFNSNKPGRMVGLRLSPAKLFAGKYRDLVINMYWDNDPKPAVSCPISDFFGYSFGDPATKSLFLGTAGDMNYLYLPMIYSQSARIEIVSEKGKCFNMTEGNNVVYFKLMGQNQKSTGLNMRLIDLVFEKVK